MKEYKYKIGEKEYIVAIKEFEEKTASVIVNGEEILVEIISDAVHHEKKEKPGNGIHEVSINDTTSETEITTIIDSNKSVKAPLPGVITDIKVTVGQQVNKGDVVIVLEAMKMANNIEAENDGRVKAIYVGVGENVLEDALLIAIE